MASQRKRKRQNPAADQGDAYEPVAGEIVKDDFPPKEHTPESVVQSVTSNTQMPPDQGEGKKEWVKSLNCISDPQAGMRFHFDYEFHLAVITFEAEPSAAVKQKLNDGAYRYKPEVKAWLLPLTSGHWEEDRKYAKKVFWQVADVVRAEKGLPPRAQSPDQGPIPDSAMPSIDERAEHVLEQAKELAERVESSAHFSNALFNPYDGIVTQTFPTLRERREFTLTKPYEAIYDILRGLMEKFGVVAGATPSQSVPSGADTAPPARWQEAEIEREQEKTGVRERSP